MEVTKFRSQIFIALEHVTVQLHRAQNTLTGLAGNVIRTESELRKLLAGSFNGIVVANDKITKQLSVAIEQMTVHLQHGKDTLTGLVKSVAERPRRLHGLIPARQNDLRRLLATSFDGIVVTDPERRVVAANPIALDLFGVSEANMKKFTIDAFISRGQVPYFDANGLPFVGRKESHGKCKIRCLDGSMRVAEYIFIANFVPFQHLSRFRKYQQWPPGNQLTGKGKNRHWPLRPTPSS